MKKPRFNLGDKFKYNGDTMEVVGVYRVTNDPEWHYVLDNDAELSQLTRAIDAMAQLMRPEPPDRFVKNPFRNPRDAETYFRQITCKGNFRAFKTNKEIIDTLRKI